MAATWKYLLPSILKNSCMKAGTVESLARPGAHVDFFLIDTNQLGKEGRLFRCFLGFFRRECHWEFPAHVLQLRLGAGFGGLHGAGHSAVVAHRGRHTSNANATAPLSPPTRNRVATALRVFKNKCASSDIFAWLKLNVYHSGRI